MDSDSYLSDNDEAKLENWYSESDTSENLPDPNESKDPLYQEENKLPTLTKNHFCEGIVILWRFVKIQRSACWLWLFMLM